MSTSAGLGKLKKAAKELRAQWGETHGAWHDENSRRFEEDFVVPLLARLEKVELTLAQLGSVLQRVHRDCQ
jgi:hypothetical protein